MYRRREPEVGLTWNEHDTTLLTPKIDIRTGNTYYINGEQLLSQHSHTLGCEVSNNAVFEHLWIIKWLRPVVAV